MKNPDMSPEDADNMDLIVTTIAVATHQQNRAWCIAHGDYSQLPWGDAPDWQKDSAIAEVVGVLDDGNTPEQSHEGWLASKRAAGWSYGEKKDPEAKTHPCMVPYSELPEEQRTKDALFVAMVLEISSVLDTAVLE